MSARMSGPGSAGRVVRGIAAVAMAVGLAGGMAVASQGAASAAPAPAVARPTHSTPGENRPDHRPAPQHCFWDQHPGHWGWGWHWTRARNGWGWHWTWGWNPGRRVWECR
jgi:hypothetical protein